MCTRFDDKPVDVDQVLKDLKTKFGVRYTSLVFYRAYTGYFTPSAALAPEGRSRVRQDLADFKRSWELPYYVVFMWKPTYA